MSIAENLAQVKQQIREAALAAGRDPESVRLIAVSKTKPVSDLREALAAGQRELGENYAQELRDKAEQMAGEPVEWHFIGGLQRNKVKYVVNKAALIHAVDSLRLGQEISKRASGRQPILVSVNLGDEQSKSGVPASEALALCTQLMELPGVELRGLMCIPPPGQGQWFQQLAELAAAGRAQGLPLTELSMGMSADYREAIAHGATYVRVGSAIFGSRG
ncbi:MAG: YggS family pyridoxal phosphate-dependent enzyme [Myxococcota bacterium]|nr:YggS family pyridoxal phosphate-dependent enzyme [Myxococcota bacterium]